MRVADRGGELERVLSTHAAGLARLAARMQSASHLHRGKAALKTALGEST